MNSFLKKYQMDGRVVAAIRLVYQTNESVFPLTPVQAGHGLHFRPETWLTRIF